MSKNYGNDSQIAEIVKYISDTMKLPLIGAGGGFAPIGTINSYMGTVAPIGWLACDGTVYNIADYPDLATHIASHFGSTNFFGGDGTTTFAVPDLRGEFLRGSGTNSHTNQGSGANVGVHQDGTKTSSYIADANSLYSTVYDGGVENADYREQINNYIYFNKAGGGTDAVNYGRITSRPTNTSVLFIIKATVAGDPNAHQYSTDEQVVGTDIDGSIRYEKTIVKNNVTVSDNTPVTLATIPNIKNLKCAFGYITETDGDYALLEGGLRIKRVGNNIIIVCIDSHSFANAYVECTIQYTKTQ